MHSKQLSLTFGSVDTKVGSSERRLVLLTERLGSLRLLDLARQSLQLVLILDGSATHSDVVLKYSQQVSKSNHNFLQQLSSLVDFFDLLDRSKNSVFQACSLRSAALVGLSFLPS